MRGESMYELIETIFSKYPKPPCTYRLTHSPDVSLFQLLMSLLINGAKRLYGENITPNDITEEQFKELQSYIESVGYKIKYNFSNIPNPNNTNGEQARIINIWFEEIIDYMNCHGIRVIK
jgi:hypothetical protein